MAKTRQQHPGRNGFVYESRGRDQSDSYEGERAQALGPWEPAKEQPPKKNSQTAPENANQQRVHRRFGNYNRKDKQN